MAYLQRVSRPLGAVSGNTGESPGVHWTPLELRHLPPAATQSMSGTPGQSMSHTSTQSLSQGGRSPLRRSTHWQESRGSRNSTGTWRLDLHCCWCSTEVTSYLCPMCRSRSPGRKGKGRQKGRKVGKGGGRGGECLRLCPCCVSASQQRCPRTCAQCVGTGAPGVRPLPWVGLLSLKSGHSTEPHSTTQHHKAAIRREKRGGEKMKEEKKGCTGASRVKVRLRQ